MQSAQFLDDDAPISNWPNCTNGWFIRMRAERNMVITADDWTGSSSILYIAQTNANFSADNHTNQLWTPEDIGDLTLGGFTLKNNAT